VGSVLDLVSYTYANRKVVRLHAAWDALWYLERSTTLTYQALAMALPPRLCSGAREHRLGGVRSLECCPASRTLLGAL
jgi:hypothetical protein